MPDTDEPSPPTDPAASLPAPVGARTPAAKETEPPRPPDPQLIKAHQHLALLAEKGVRHFRLAALTRDGVTTAQATAAVAEAIEDGTLAHSFEVICPESGRTLQTFASQEELDRTRRVKCLDCADGEHELRQLMVWETFTPTTLPAALRAA